MTKKHGRAEIRFKLEHDLYDAAEEAFREAGLSIETGLTLFLAQVAKQHIEGKVVDEPHDVFATVDELMEYLEEREERRAAEKAAARQAKKNEKVLAELEREEKEKEKERLKAAKKAEKADREAAEKAAKKARQEAKKAEKAAKDAVPQTEAGVEPQAAHPGGAWRRDGENQLRSRLPSVHALQPDGKLPRHHAERVGRRAGIFLV